MQLLGPAIKPASSIFTPTGDAQAAVPIARLIDADKFLGTNADILTGTDIGMAEYTNGNFLSRDTMFRDFALPLQPDIVAGILEPAGRGFRRYFRKRSGDGEPVRHFVAEAALYRYMVADTGSAPVRGWTLDDKVHQDYASLLLPRAVGYSAALLDYFFRGKLDVALVNPDPNDPSVVQLSGTNASADALVDGALRLYAENANGQRSPVPPVGGDATIAAVGAGDMLTSAIFRVPDEAERFVAVYEGALGDEAKTATFPGAVVGKVLGGARVEEVFNDGTQWKIRTPAGVFDLPLTTATYEEVKWGDGDSTLVGRTSFGLGAANRFVAWTVKRKPGSVEFDLDLAVGPTALKIAQKAAAPFPDGLVLGTTLSVNVVVNYGQTLPRLTVTTQMALINGSCLAGSQTYSSLTFEKVVSRSLPFSLNVPLTLDLSRNDGVRLVTRPYLWSLLDYGADETGRLVALVKIQLTQPEWSGVPVPVLIVDSNGAPTESTTLDPNIIAPPVPQPGVQIFALIDIAARGVIASTAGPVVTMSHINDDGPGNTFGYGIAVHKIQTGCGPFDAWSMQTRSLNASVADEILDVEGRETYFDTLSGYLRPELATAVTGAGLVTDVLTHVTTTQLEPTFLYRCGEQKVCGARVMGPVTRVTRDPLFIEQVSLVRSIAGRERLTLVVDDSTFNDDLLSAVVAWDPAAPQAAVRYRSEAGFLFVGPATANAALLSNYGDDDNGVVVDLNGAAANVDVPGVDLAGSSFVLLAPRYVYNTDDLRFYRLPDLAATALPRLLADAGGNPFGSYHSITLP